MPSKEDLLSICTSNVAKNGLSVRTQRRCLAAHTPRRILGLVTPLSSTDRRPCLCILGKAPLRGSGGLFQNRHPDTQQPNDPSESRDRGTANVNAPPSSVVFLLQAVVLVGTASRDKPTFPLLTRVFTLCSASALRMIIRPTPAGTERHTLDNILETGWYTLNAMTHAMTQRGHHISTFCAEQSDSKECGFEALAGAS